MSKSKRTEHCKNWSEIRRDKKLIYEGLTAVSDVIWHRDNDSNEFFEFSASRSELMILLYHYCEAYVRADDLYFFYGQVGGECERLADASDRIDQLAKLLGQQAVKEMFEAVNKEWDAKIRESLCPNGLELYEGILDGCVSPAKWHGYNYERAGLENPYLGDGE